MQSNILKSTDFDTILVYNLQVPSKDNLQSFIRISISFPCHCINGEFLGHFITYNVKTQDTYGKVIDTYYVNILGSGCPTPSNIGSGDQTRPNNTLLNYRKDNAPKCYSVVHSANTQCP
uniref:Uncharacterized protein n=1 Tax=Populus trichocarpa TaxID=3694 RepID=B9MWA1_POPTR